ncbi:MAG: hypothetical protein ABS897_08795 [Eubacteriales bacterium]
MYAVKVETGRERPEVRRISTGFLPTYRVYTGSTEDKTVRWLVVPGYVFSLSMTRKAEPVPNEEWEIIDKLSASAISTVDKSGKILSGPLTGLDRYVTKTGKDYVQLCVNLLGEARTYRLLCRIEDGTEEAEEAKESEAKMADAASAKKELSEDQIMAALKRAEKVGIRAAASEFGMAWQTLSWIRRKSTAAAVPEKKAPEEQTITKRGPGRPKKADAKGNGPKIVKAVAQQLSEAELEAENAALRKQVEELTAKLEKAKTTLAGVMDEI